MAPTEGRVAKPERRWDCRRGTPSQSPTHVATVKTADYTVILLIYQSIKKCLRWPK